MPRDKEKQDETAAEANAPYNQPRKQHYRSTTPAEVRPPVIEAFMPAGRQWVFTGLASMPGGLAAQSSKGTQGLPGRLV